MVWQAPMRKGRRVNRKRAVDRVDADRRTFCGTAAAALAAARLRLLCLPAGAAPSAMPVKQIDAGLLSVAYAEAGPSSGPPVILLHGWPYDIHSFDEVAPIL